MDLETSSGENKTGKRPDVSEALGYPFLYQRTVRVAGGALEPSAKKDPSASNRQMAQAAGILPSFGGTIHFSRTGASESFFANKRMIPCERAV